MPAPGRNLVRKQVVKAARLQLGHEWTAGEGGGLVCKSCGKAIAKLTAAAKAEECKATAFKAAMCEAEAERGHKIR